MTHIPPIQLIRLQHPPPGHDEDSYGKWQTQFRELMAELKYAARNVVRRSNDPTILDLLDAVQACRTDPIGFGLVEHLYEFAAFHVCGPSRRTIAQCAVDAAEYLPHTLRGYLEPLAASYWELHEVHDIADNGAIDLRRIHDDATVELGALEMQQAFVSGTVHALRVFDAGGFFAAPVALVLEQDGIAGLVNRLEVECHGRFDSRAEYMHRRGSALILRHALQRHVRRLAAPRPMPEPAVSLVESTLPRDMWKQLDAAFSLVETAVGSQLAALSPLTLSRPDAGVLRVEQNGPSMALMLFDCGESHAQWASAGLAAPFIRVWRAGADELFAEDVELLESMGLAPVEDGAVVAVRLDEGRWEDLAREHVTQVVDMCRWAALRVQSDGELAA